MEVIAADAAVVSVIAAVLATAVVVHAIFSSNRLCYKIFQSMSPVVLFLWGWGGVNCCHVGAIAVHM